MGSSSVGWHRALASMTVNPVAISMNEFELPGVIGKKTIIKFLTNEVVLWKPKLDFEQTDAHDGSDYDWPILLALCLW